MDHPPFKSFTVPDGSGTIYYSIPRFTQEAATCVFVPDVQVWSSALADAIVARRSETRLDAILAAVMDLRVDIGALASQGVSIMQELDDLTADVANVTTVDQSIIDLCNGLADKIDAAAGDRAKIAALSASLRADNQKVADAVVAHTPVADPPVDPPIDTISGAAV